MGKFIKLACLLVIICSLFFVIITITREVKVDELIVNKQLKLELINKRGDFYLKSYQFDKKISQKKLTVHKFLESKDIKFKDSVEMNNKYIVTMIYSYIYNINRGIEQINLQAEIDERGVIIKILDELYNIEHLF